MPRPKAIKPSAVSTDEMREKTQQYLLNHLDEMFADIDELKGKERINARFKLMDFVFAKVQAVQANETNKTSSGEELLAEESAYQDTITDEDL